MPLTIPLPADLNSRRFVGPNGKLPAGTDLPSDPNYAMQHVILVDAEDNPLVSSVEGTLLASAARTATASGDLTNRSGRGGMFFLTIAATPNNAETLTLLIQGRAPSGGSLQTLTTFTALVASALGATPSVTFVFTVYPGAAETAATTFHEVQALPLPRSCRAVVLHSSTGSWTYSLTYALIP